MALNKPSNKAIFFKNFSVFKETSEGNKNLKIEFSTPSIYFYPLKFCEAGGGRPLSFPVGYNKKQS